MKIEKCFKVFAVACILLSNCSKKTDSSSTVTEPQPNPPSTTSPVETNAPNANYRPAFANQTRVAGVTTTTAFQATIVTSALSQPWGITTLPDGRFLITEKSGQMRIVTSSGAVGTPLSGIPAVNASGQGGLLGVCIDPQFASNRMVYWTFCDSGTGGTGIAVAKGRLSINETAIESPTIIYRTSPKYSGTVNLGSRVIFDPAGNLLVSIGDRFDNNIRALAQSATSTIGKIIRITTNGLPAPGNPTINQPGALAEVYSMGHRNPQGLAIHPTTGDLWQSEHGPRGGDEINRVQAGANYGWPIISYGIEYSGQAVGAAIQQQTGMEQPVYYWDPVVSPSGMTFYKGGRVPEWRNNLFIGSLTQTHIIRLVIENNRVVGEERLLASENQRFRDITQASDSSLYAVTDAGRLYKIDRR